MNERAIRLSASVPRVPPPYRSMASFIAAVRIGEPMALRQLYLFHAPLLRDQARKLGVSAGECDELVTTVLDDFVLHLSDTEIVPRELARYLVGALRNRARNRHRDAQRLRDTDEAAYVEHGPAGQRIVAESHSEYGLRSALGPDAGADAVVSAAIGKLAAASVQALRPDELAMMVGLGRHVPLRQLAEEAGITYGNARVRLHRLRERFRKLALQHLESISAEERREMERFFRRAGITLAAPPSARGTTDDTV
jgi:DNA-directed RNA polymerase specialized sigma24 family protein